MSVSGWDHSEAGDDTRHVGRVSIESDASSSSNWAGNDSGVKGRSVGEQPFTPNLPCPAVFRPQMAAGSLDANSVVMASTTVRVASGRAIRCMTSAWRSRSKWSVAILTILPAR